MPYASIEDERERCRRHYQRHKGQIAGKRKEAARPFREWISTLNSTWFCTLCHEDVYLWHHVDPTEKAFNIADGHSYSLDALEDELEKCVPLCLSCHSRWHIHA